MLCNATTNTRSSHGANTAWSMKKPKLPVKKAADETQNDTAIFVISCNYTVFRKKLYIYILNISSQKLQNLLACFFLHFLH